MKNTFVQVLLVFLLFNFAINAQLTVKDQESTPNTLLQVNDEGNAGSITLPPLSSIGTPTNKLYNIGSSLFWNGGALGTAGSAAGWTELGSNVILSTLSDKVGIGTSSPSANLHVTGNDGVIFRGTLGSGSVLNLGAGTRMMWYPKKAAFRAGDVANAKWDDANIGDYSIAAGFNTEASGFSAVSMGHDNTASGAYSCGLGMSTSATGNYSTSMGRLTKANSFASTAIGVNNIGGGSAESWGNSDPLFEIGNGLLSPSNALTVLKNGNVGIGIHTPSYKLDVDGGNIMVQGLNSSQTNGDEGILYLGTVHHYIKGVYGYGLKLGTYAAADAMVIEEESGNVGIGTTNPDAKLEVNGTVKIGANGIKFSEIIELTGTTGLTGTSSIYVDYPTGYTSGNSRVLSLEIEDTYGGWASNGLYYNGGTVHCYLWGQIKIGYPDHADFQSRPFRLVLMKVE